MKMDDHIEIGYREMQVMTIPYQVVVFGICVAFVLFSAFAGVNRITTRNLLRRFKTIERVVTATKEELMEVEHVGAKTAEHIREVLNTEYKE